MVQFAPCQKLYAFLCKDLELYYQIVIVNNQGFLLFIIDIIMKYHLIHKDNLRSALDKAKQYRSLLEPELAVSICLDIFAVDADHQEALVIYILALSDTLSQSSAGTHKPDKKILDSIKKLQSDYQQSYYQGIFYERKARALMKNAMSRSFAYNLLSQAIECYQQAEKLSPKGSDDGILRYNACLRTIENEHLQPRQDMDDISWQHES